METNLFVANLRKYNGGITQGEWFTLPTPLDEILEAIGVDGSPSGGEEYVVLDYENPCGLPVSECDIEQLNYYTEAIENLDYHILENLPQILEAGYESLDDLLANGGENYIVYEAQSEEELGVEVFGQFGTFDEETLLRYFDYKSYGRDLAIADQFLQGGNGNYIGFVG